MRVRNVVRTTGMVVVLLLSARAAMLKAAEPARRVPLIYSTDLFHPHDDPDDHFDLATVFALPELDVKAVILDQGQIQKQRPGTVVVEQMMKLTGRRVPVVTGLSKPLKSPDDKADDQPKEDQGAVEMLLRILRESPEPVTMITVGSERDVCAAFNREPALLKQKLARLYINTGNVETGSEWNVQLDVHSYVGLMRSGLPLYWCPCMPANKNVSTHWVFRQGDVLDTAPQPLQNFFIYALQQVKSDEIDPMAALSMNLRPWRHLVFKMDRSMWSTASILDAAGRRVYRDGDRWVAAATAPHPGDKPADVYSFVPVRAEIDAKGITKWTDSATDSNMRLYRVQDPKNHAAAMKSCLQELFKQFPTAGK